MHQPFGEMQMLVKLGKKSCCNQIADPGLDQTPTNIAAGMTCITM